MGLVEYSDSEEDQAEPVRKRPRLSNDGIDKTELPPLPAEFHDLYSHAARVSNSDDPSLHGGRKRIVPHVEGNWAAHVYLEWHPPTPDTALLDRLLVALQSTRPATAAPLISHLYSPTSVPLPLHISLSAPLVLRTESKSAFHTALLTALRSTLRNLKTRATGTLTLAPTGLAWHPNHECTRSFLVLRLSRPQEDGEAMNRLLQAANGVAREFGCPELYAGGHSGGAGPGQGGEEGEKRAGRKEGREEVLDRTDRFHISIAWSLDAGEKLEVEGMSDEAKQVMQEVKGMSISFKDVKVKLGREVTSVPFAASGRSSARDAALF
ncbi:U6 snRNA phosphodiesterase-like protein [Elsinoe australis]|uniref:U6 snRNA phosphodiesterase n=1 Tax=Elsinoe australis TaxID=40998 RepID=A0A4U7B2N1_9PEZI|nr:U6 snRNA phosphodiesterase-like protein [Elsinoe australis]